MEDNLCKYMNCSNCNLIDCLDGCEDISSCQECKDKMLSDHDKQIRDETIDNFVKIVNAHIRDEMVLGESVKWMIEDFAEQIKGEQNE